MDGGTDAGVVEANFDGLVGPTHHYGGLASGNLASQRHAAQASNPREAALQGLAKMRALASMGMAQGLLPPQERPHLPTLRRLGFTGTDRQIIERVAQQAPELLGTVSSAAAMWTANAATVSPAADCADGRVHFTPANLCSQLHRAIEAETSARVLRAVFPDPLHFEHHPPLPGIPALGDEGAANHTRLCSDYAEPGIELFVYGAGDGGTPRSQRFAARQTRLASESVARLHALRSSHTFFAQQQPQAIDAGVFHNDVIAVGNRELLLYHEQAFVDTPALLAGLRAAWQGSRALQLVCIPSRELSLEQAVSSYLFNSQLICPPDGGMRLIVAAECREQAPVWACIQRLLADEHNPITGVEVFDLRQSMHNGGGPACLRLRVVLNQSQRRAVNPACWIDAAQARKLESWVHRHYRDRLSTADLADPQLLAETYIALDELTSLLDLGSVYDFQLA